MSSVVATKRRGFTCLVHHATLRALSVLSAVGCFPFCSPFPLLSLVSEPPPFLAAAPKVSKGFDLSPDPLAKPFEKQVNELKLRPSPWKVTARPV